MSYSEEAWAGYAGQFGEFDATIVDARFATKEFSNGASYRLEIMTDNENQRFPWDYGIGRGWTISDDGMTVKRGDGIMSFMTKTTYYHFFSAAMESDGFLKHVQENGLVPTDARTWVGLRFHFKEQEINFGDDRDGKPIKSKRFLPTKFLGVDNSISSSGAIPDDVSGLLRSIAIESDYQEFQRAAMKLPAVVGNKTLLESILRDDSYYKSLGGGTALAS